MRPDAKIKMKEREKKGLSMRRLGFRIAAAAAGEDGQA